MPTVGQIQNPAGNRTDWGATFSALAWLPVVFFVLLITLLWSTRDQETFGPVWLLPMLNAVLATAVALLVSVLIARSVVAGGRRTFLLLGSGMLAYALASALGGICAPTGHLSEGVAIFNLGVCLAGAMNLSGAVALLRPPTAAHQRGGGIRTLWITYLGVLLVLGGVVWGAFTGMLPLFFVPGSGPTAVRHLVLGVTIAEFGGAAVVLLLVNWWRKSEFLHWYAWGLGLIALGFLGVFGIRHVGNPLGWAGTLAMYFGIGYLLVATFQARRQSGRWHIRLEHLQETHARYMSLVEYSPDAIVVQEDGQLLFVNPAAIALFGATTETELLDRSLFELIDPDYRECAAEQLRRSEAPHHATPAFEMRIRRLDDTVVDVEVVSAPVEFAGHFTTQLVMRNISARKQTEYEFQQLMTTLHAERDQISAILNSISDEIWFADTNRAFSLVNSSGVQAFLLASGGPVEVEKLAASLEVYRSDGSLRPVEEAPPLRALLGEIVRNEEEIIRTPDSGELRHRQVSAAPVRDAEGQVVGSVSVVRDITVQKQMETALRESDARFRAAFEQGAVGMTLAALDGTFLQANPAFCTMLGYTEAELKTRSFYDLTYPGDLKDNLAGTRLMISGESSVFRMEKRYIHKDGHLVWADMSSVAVYDAQGEFSYYVTHMTDITARKLAEEALRESEARFRTLTENIPDQIMRFDGHLRLLYANPAVLQRIGLPAETLIGRTAAEYGALPASTASWEQVAREVLESGEPRRYEHTSQWQGETQVLDAYVVPERDAEGNVSAVITIARNITARKRAEAALEESERRVMEIVESIQDGFFATSSDWRLTYVNRHAAENLGLTPETMVGKIIWEAFPHILGTIQETQYRRAMTERVPVEFELEGLLTPRWYEIRCYPTKDGISVYCVDITARKQTEQALQKSLLEKDVLLKEIHHRVKNNMQVISSLVSLQADSLDNPELRNLFSDLRDQVRSMALVHEKLYQSASLANVDFAEYTHTLLTYLWRAHGDAATRVRLTLDVHPVSLSVEEAVPCGLILNELVTNTLKHAFGHRADGELCVSLQSDPQNGVCLRVSDNGVGFPVDLDWRHAPSLGLRLVQMLTGQLGGKLEMCSDDCGTNVTLLFVCKKHSPLPAPGETHV